MERGSSEEDAGGAWDLSPEKVQTQNVGKRESESELRTQKARERELESEAGPASDTESVKPPVYSPNLPISKTSQSPNHQPIGAISFAPPK
ncbi:hypothetical protein PBF_05723 [Cytobacillus firmus DS1]|uniref:Uncharacterized protein n=1 Tax=Cytobacillus firmus DS1 TaxID=1307436 RepID=W7L1M4_CYTFI|nr:hypothetical protein PBF_05723 [Cytobacillus firmus DS1]